MRALRPHARGSRAAEVAVIPVDQTRFTVPEGDCFNACVASLLELPLAEVPHFCSHDDWWSYFNGWLEARGLYAINFQLTNNWRPEGLYILNGRSPRGTYNHSVVALRDRVVHDPHPSRAGIRTTYVDDDGKTLPLKEIPEATILIPLDIMAHWQGKLAAIHARLYGARLVGASS
jgi:RNase P/RNase MRP subunit p29